MFPVDDDVVPSFPPPSIFIRAPCSKKTSCPSPLYFLPICPLSARFCVFSRLSSSVCSPPSSVPHRPSVGELPTLRLRPTNFLFWFPDPASHMQVFSPPRPVRLVVLGLGVGGGAKEMAPPVVVLSLLSSRQASPASGQVHAYARRSISLLILAVPAVVLSPSSCWQASSVKPLSLLIIGWCSSIPEHRLR